MPAADCPDDSPSVAAVITQPNASVAVPAGAVASTPRECAVTWGVIVAPASSIATISAGSGPATAIAATHTAKASSSTGSRRCSGARPGPQGVGDARQHRRDRPRREQHAAERRRAGGGRHRGHADLDGADDQAEPQRREHDRAQARHGERAEQARGSRGHRAVRADRVGQREAAEPITISRPARPPCPCPATAAPRGTPPAPARG